MEDKERGSPNTGLTPETSTNAVSRTPPPDYSLPDYPFVSTNLANPSEAKAFKDFLHEQLLTPALDELSPYLWLVATPKGSHIISLHEHVIHGREIVKTEKAKLHLLWHRNRVFIKPLPSYTIDDEFRKEHLSDDAKLGPAIRGFLRSWAYLLRCPSDLEIALENKLLPTDRKQYDHLFSVLKRYSDIKDEDVALRYNYGDLRLGRINFYNRVIRRKLHYHKIYTHYGAYFGRFMEPFLFLFGTASVVLSAMQVVLAALVTVTDEPWRRFASSARSFSVGSILVVVGAFGLLAAIFVFMVVREAQYALRQLIKKRINRR